MPREPIPASDSRALDFRSDNVAGIAPEILAAMAAINHGAESAYGDDGVTQRLTACMAELFERDVAVYPVSTGTAANSLALAACVPAGGIVLCHEAAHIANSECNAPEFFAGGAKLTALPGEHGKLSPATLEARLKRATRGVHQGRVAAVSISQPTETGAVYTPHETAQIARICRDHGLKLHMDGARFANALVRLGCSPAEATWKAGVDVLSFGLTKNGAFAAEAIVFFDPALAQGFAYLRKRGGHLFSKMRFISAQFEALLTDGLWLRLAARANAMAARLGEGLTKLDGVRLVHPVETNQLFVILPDAAVAVLETAGYRFHPWESDQGPCIRLVTAFDTEPAHIDAFVALLRNGH